MSENQDLLRELSVCALRVRSLRHRVLQCSPAAEELLRAAERLLLEEVVSEQQKEAS